MSTTRTFIAVDLSPGVRKRAADLLQRLRASEARVSWVLPANMHLTLKFLGDQSDQQVADVCRAVATAAGQQSPFEFVCQGAGAFPDLRRPRTLWLGVGDGAASVVQLQQCVENELAELGYVRERRAYRPHLTLGRVRGQGEALEQLAQTLTRARDFAAGSVTVHEVLVMGSYLRRNGPQYDVLARAPLQG